MIPLEYKIQVSNIIHREIERLVMNDKHDSPEMDYLLDKKNEHRV